MRKKFLIGIIISAIFFTITFAFATPIYNALNATFPIFLDGKEWEPDAPVFVIDGTTYLPLKSIGNLLDVDISWNDELNRVEINTVSQDNEELFDDTYWEKYYEEYYNEIFSKLYDENEELKEEYIDLENNDIEDVEDNSVIEEIKSENATYIGNKNTKKLHLATCQSAKKLKEENREYFSNISDAKGYTKCQICNP